MSEEESKLNLKEEELLGEPLAGEAEEVKTADIEAKTDGESESKAESDSESKKEVYASLGTEFSENSSIIGKVFVGGYILIFGWFLLHSLIYFWDLLMAWNTISLWEYFFFYGFYLAALLLASLILMSICMIFTFPSFSCRNSWRFQFRLCGFVLLYSLWWSNLLGEPLAQIGSSWFGEDLRYPAFMSSPGFFIRALIFLNDLGASFGNEEDGIGQTLMFRPYWRSRSLESHHAKYKENLSGILGLVYIYFGYWVIFFTATDTYLEFFAVLFLISTVRNSFGYAPTFMLDRQYYKLAIVPLYVALRAYFAYDEWLAKESLAYLSMNVLFCLSHLIIFASWYCPANSFMGKTFIPYFLTAVEIEPQKED